MGEQSAYYTERLDHLGIVAGICQEIELIEQMAEIRQFHTVQIEAHSVPKYHQRGQPHAEQLPDYYVWQPELFW